MLWYTLVAVGTLLAGGAFNASRVDTFVENNHYHLVQLELKNKIK
jgi:hypothetical protein